MTTFYFCKQCDTVIAETPIVQKHRSAGHHVDVIEQVEELRKFGIMRDPNNNTSSTNGAQDLSINCVRKLCVYIGKSGKEISTRRDGSYVQIQYEHLDDITGVATKITEQEYYKLLFSNGIPDVNVMHTCNNMQDGVRGFLKNIHASRFRTAMVTTDPSDDSRLIFMQECNYPVDYDELMNPYGVFITYVSNDFRTNVDRDTRLLLSRCAHEQEIIYYDVLEPRSEYLTRVLITAHNNERAAELDGKIRRFIMYELSDAEAEALDSRTSFDWATNIVQDARSILC